MHLRNRQDQIIASIKQSDLPKLKRFLKSLKVSSESGEMLDCFLRHPKCMSEAPHLTEVYEIDTDDKGQFVIVMGKRQFHLFIKKNKASQKLLEGLLKAIPFQKYKFAKGQKLLKEHARGKLSVRYSKSPK